MLHPVAQRRFAQTQHQEPHSLKHFPTTDTITPVNPWADFQGFPGLCELVGLWQLSFQK